MQKLDLSDNQLTDLPDELLQLDHLAELNLSGNRLATIPPAIGDLVTVVHLGLGDNQLTTLPPELGELSQLVSLDLSANQLTALPAELAQASNLKHLNLSGNQSTTLPPELGLLSQLDSLDLSDNQLAAVPPVLTQFRLEVLNLSHNQLTELPLELDQLRPLLSLDLRGNPLTTCPLPLPWQIDRYIYPPDEDYVDFNHWYLSSPTSTEYPDLPFLDLPGMRDGAIPALACRRRFQAMFPAVAPPWLRHRTLGRDTTFPGSRHADRGTGTEDRHSANLPIRRFRPCGPDARPEIRLHPQDGSNETVQRHNSVVGPSPRHGLNPLLRTCC